MVAKKKPRKIYLGRLDYCANEWQRKKLIKQMNGEVLTYNMYENIKNVPTLNEIEKMPFESARTCIERLRELHSVITLRDHWKCSHYHLYNKIFKKYGIKVAEPVNRSKRNYPEHIVQPKRNKDLTLNNITIEQKRLPLELEEVKNENVIETPIEDVSTFKFNISLGGKFVGETFKERLTNINSVLNEDSNYKVELFLNEVGENKTFSFNIDGIYNGQDIKSRLMSVSGIIGKEEEYIIKYIVNEIA